MPSLNSQQVAAAQEFVDAAINALKTERGVHAETAVAALARMAGTFLFRSFDFPKAQIEPGQAVLSEQANADGPVLVEILAGVLPQIGVPLNKDAFTLSLGPENQPLQNFLETQRLLEPAFREISTRHSLSLEEAAHSCAVATALLIEKCAQVLDSNIAAALAVYGFVEGTKTAPDPVVLAE